MISRWGRYVGVSFPPAVYLPWTFCWAFGLTALFAVVTGVAGRWRPDAGVLVSALTLAGMMLLVRAQDDIRDADYDRRVNPGRPLPSGLVAERDLVVLVAAGSVLLVLLNAGRGAALLVLAAQIAYTAAVVALERLAGWPHRDRLGLQFLVNLPILVLPSLYVYAAFLRGQDRGAGAAGLAVVAAVAGAALCLELGRKTTRRPRPDERSYVSVLGPSATSFTALAAAVAGTAVVLVAIAPWRAGHAWGWLVLLPLALPALAVARFAGGAARWPLLPTLTYVPAMYLSFLAVGLLTVGGPA